MGNIRDKIEEYCCPEYEQTETKKLKAENKSLKELVGELKEHIEHLGEMSNTCTKSYTGNVCRTCKCGKAKQHTEGE